MRRFFTLLLPPLLACAMGLAGAPAAAQFGSTKAVVQTSEVRAELLAHAPQGVAPGSAVWLGLRITHQSGWHTYWKNPGDSGLPTQLEWTLPGGTTASEILWPLPKKLPVGPLVNYGFEGDLLLPVRLDVGPDFKPPLLGAGMDIRLKASWLVCKLECIPQEGEFALKLPASSSTAWHGALFDAALAAQPKTLDATGSRAEVAAPSIRLTVSGLPASWRGRNLEAFAETAELINHAGPIAQSWTDDRWQAELPLSPHRSAAPSTMPLLLALAGQGYRVEPKLLGAWPRAAAPTGLSPALAAALRDNTNARPGAPAANPLTWASALLGALLGGLVLNLMPCVFPILAVKMAGFARHSNDRRWQRIGGLAYTAGVLSSLLLLGLALLALRGAGESLGWGFQLQEPWVVAGLALLFTVIGLNLAGLFEFGSMLPSRLAVLEARHPGANAFLTGILAVAVASPCSAPFMGASLGFAIDLPAPQALAVFASLGLGLALPYLAASFIPAFARALPRPGAWMLTLRHLLAFPMFATVAWLVWVLGQQSGIDGAGALLLLLVLSSALVWALTLRGQARVLVAGSALAIAAFSAWGLAPYIGGRDAANQKTARAGDASSPWQTWEPGRVEQALADGQPVFVDFTAAWCVTCQFNKQTVLTDAALLREIAAKKVLLLRADWTRRDPAITAALAQLGRNGIPVYALHQAGRAPVLLPELLSVAEVRAALAKL
jgi:thiol:disulfide interchange protein/DsbC/DsbD-like thiol-disulfide interchange protein